MRVGGLTPGQLFALPLGGGEALGSAMDEADGGCALGVLACCRYRVVVEVTDWGCGFELGPSEDTPQVDEAAERGRGIKLMRLLVDSVTIGRKPTGQGTRVRMVKLLA